jgi:transketolase
VADAGLDIVRSGNRGTVIAVGPMLDRVLAATEDRDVTVAYAATVRPFDSRGLRATLTEPDVAVVEPYLAGTSVPAVTAALRDTRHRVLGLGVGRHDLRRYGTVTEHDAAHGLDITGLRGSLDGFFAG